MGIVFLCSLSRRSNYKENPCRGGIPYKNSSCEISAAALAFVKSNVTLCFFSLFCRKSVTLSSKALLLPCWSLQMLGQGAGSLCHPCAENVWQNCHFDEFDLKTVGDLTLADFSNQTLGGLGQTHFLEKSVMTRLERTLCRLFSKYYHSPPTTDVFCTPDGSSLLKSFPTWPAYLIVRQGLAESTAWTDSRLPVIRVAMCL